MLGTCIKHEWKSSWKMMTLINAAAVVMGLLGGIGMFVAEYRELPTVLIFLYFLFYLLLLAGAAFLTNFLMVQRYYRNLFTDEGYLTNVLPVSSHCQILSKFLVYAIWMVLDVICILGSVALLLLPLLFRYSSAEFSAAVSEIADEFWKSLSCFLGIKSPALLALYLVAAILIQTAFGILHFYVSINLGSLFSTRKVLAAVLIYLGISTVLQVVGFIVGFTQMSFAFTSSDPSEVSAVMSSPAVCGSFGIYGILSLILYAVLAVVFYYLCHYVLSRHLNLS